MTCSYFHLLLLLLSFSFILAHGDQALVAKICKATPYPELCASTVDAGPPGESNDAKGIAGIIVKAASDKSHETLVLLKGQKSQDPSFDLVVAVCTPVYAKTDEALAKTAAKIDSSASKAVGGAVSGLAICREKFEVESGPRELPKMQDLIEQLLAIALKAFSFL